MKLKEILIFTVPILVLFLIVPSSGNVDNSKVRLPFEEISYGHSWGGEGDGGDLPLESSRPYFSRTPCFFIDIIRFIMSAQNDFIINPDNRKDSRPAEIMKSDKQVDKAKTKPSTIKRTIK